MFNLKVYFDAAQAANGEVMRIAEEVDAQFNLGTEEGIAEAMARRESLDAAQAKAKAAEDLYQSMRSAAQRGESSEAARFVPANDDAEKAAGKKKTITRKEYEEMNFLERGPFLASGGTIVDELAE